MALRGSGGGGVGVATTMKKETPIVWKFKMLSAIDKSESENAVVHLHKGMDHQHINPILLLVADILPNF